MNIRIATLDDVKSIAKVHVDSWRTTYRKTFPEAYLKSLSYKKREQLWEKVIPKGGVYLAENELGEVIGFASGGLERTESYDKYQGELYAIYILENYQKQGTGKELVNTILQYLKRKQINSMLVWVIEKNNSCMFYESLGGGLIDKTEVEIDGRKYIEVAYGWDNLSAD
ncbi:GNAT family N-acetyltransferase [Rossellomorea sp. DA94]|uniref:GNAT family N-acetyltransferase n=1 Tax=Rossellomorea sp. DA94 TaxID=3038653 RepID=UPI00244765FB|nr:GNAT family N-acetyltransferase [Rossellomorea sp. DA94]WGG44608.1 GNAT family N-acetyltransferase [Rossellomorea sp. DA94]